MVIAASTNGVKAAKAAGMYCVDFKSPHSSHQNYALADLLISDFESIKYEKYQSCFNR